MPKVKTSFNSDLKTEFPFLKLAREDDKHRVVCTICGGSFGIGHRGRKDINEHLESLRHKSGQQTIIKNHKIGDFFTNKTADASTDALLIRAQELTFAFHSGKHRISLRTAECTSGLITKLFNKKFSGGRTKTSALILKVSRRFKLYFSKKLLLKNFFRSFRLSLTMK